MRVTPSVCLSGFVHFADVEERAPWSVFMMVVMGIALRGIIFKSSHPVFA
jgi:hypothetical protein